VPASAGASCSDGSVCNGIELCDGAGICLAGTPLALSDGDDCTVDACDPVLGLTHTHIAGCQTVPPDPATIAPPLDRTVVTRMSDAVSFLFQGSNAIQIGVAPGAIEANRVAVVRGSVKARDGGPLAGVKVTAVGHPELGQTVTRADGLFDLVVNGGGLVALNYAKDGFAPAQRQVQVPWQDWAWASDVVLVAYDSTSTEVQPGAGFVQVAQGSISTDSDGTRRATVLFPPGTQAYMNLADSSVALGTFHVRATEYTIGDSGRAAMPAELPPSTAYTYAVELSIDEAVSAGASSVVFSQPVPVYLENFLSIPVGQHVPAGYYDRQSGVWVPAPDGRVIRILSTSGGIASVDADGDGAADTGAALAALGMGASELTQLASSYTAGQTLWRVPVAHFSTWDFNYSWGCPAGAPCVAPRSGDPVVGTPEPDPTTDCGSIIDCQNQALGEFVPLSGTPFALSYRSDRQLGRKAERTLTVPLPTSLPPGATGVAAQVFVAGQQVMQTLRSPDRAQLTFAWDGRDVYGRPVQGSARAVVKVGFLYMPVLMTSAQGGTSFAAGNEGSSMGNYARHGSEMVAWKTWTGTLSSWTALPVGLGGWDLDVHHVYDPASKTLYLGDGGRRSASGAAMQIVTSTGTLHNHPAGLTVAPDGSIYVADLQFIERISPDGTTTKLVGGGTGAACGSSGIPGTSACFCGGSTQCITDVAYAKDGDVYFAISSGRVMRLRKDGIVEDFAGSRTQQYPVSGDGGPALGAALGYMAGIAPGSDGSLYVLAGDRIRKITPDGIIHAFAGTGGYCGLDGTCCEMGDGGLALSAQVCGGGSPGKIVVGSDESVYFSDARHHVVRRISPAGIISRFAGRGLQYVNYGYVWATGYGGDGGPATSALLASPFGVSVGPDGSAYIAEVTNHRIRRVGPDGSISTIAGSGASTAGGDGGLPIFASFSAPYQTAVAHDGSILVADYNGYGTIRKIAPAFPGFGSNEMTIASEDGRELYVFDGAGRHLRTMDPISKTNLLSFGYDGAGRLSSIVDRDGRTTSIERVGDAPFRIVAPHGQATTLSTDGNGYLSSVTNPASESSAYTYDGDGLMLSFTDPRSNVHTFHHDPLGRLDLDTNPAGGSKGLTRTEMADGYEVTVATALGRATHHRVQHVSTGDRALTQTGPDAAVTTRLDTSATTTMTRPDGTVTSTTRAADPRFGVQAPLVSGSVRTPSGLTAMISQGATATLSIPNDPTSMTALTQTRTLNGRTSRAAYDAASRIWSFTSAFGRASSATLDDKGRVSSVQLPGVPTLVFGFDAGGDLRTVTQGARSATIDYDTAGLPWRITNASGQQVTMQYDSAGRVRTETLPGSRAVGFDYDGAGNLRAITPPARDAHWFDHDAVDRVASYTPPGVPGVSEPATRYAYDLDGALASVLLPDATSIVPTVDFAGRLQSVMTSRGAVVVGYDAASRVSSIATPEGQGLALGWDGFLPTSETWTGTAAGTVSRSFDSDFRPATLSVNGSAIATWGYDADGLLTQAGALAVTRDAATGRASGTTLGSVATSYGYGTYGELESASGAGVYAYTLHRDAAGRIDGKTETVQGATSSYVYGYDTAGRLESVTRDGAVIEQYSYDDNGDRLSGATSAGTASGTFDAQDRMVSYGEAAYGFGPVGDLRSRTVGGQTTWYSYDRLGNLLQVAKPDGTVIDYVVDGLNRRVGKKVNGALVEGFLYDGRLRPVAWLDGTGAVKATFVYGLHVNVPEYMSTASGTYRILTDYLGSPRLVVDTSSGAIAQRMDYDSFGQVLSDTSPGFQPFGFAGGLYDRDTGLVRFGARDYDPQVGRWTNKDPIRFKGGLNLYVYVENNPINGADASGLWTVQIGGTIQGVWGPAAGVGFAGIAFDGHGNVGVYFGGGGGTGAGAMASGGLSVAGSNGDTINDLKGPFANVSLGGGWGPSATGDAFTGWADDGRAIAGGGFTFGPGAGAGASLGVTDTAVIDITKWLFHPPPPIPTPPDLNPPGWPPKPKPCR